MNLYKEEIYSENHVISKLKRFLPFQNPLKKFGNRWNFLTFRNVFIFFLMIMSLGILFLFKGYLFSEEIYKYAPTIFYLLA
jgi:hypothetical protein